MLEKIIRNQKINTKFGAVTAVFFALCFFYFNQTAVHAGWIQKQKITSTPVINGAQFGNATAISGNRMVVGAPHQKTTTGVMTGAAFVYELINGTWAPKAQLFAAGGMAGDEFGYSVAISGNTIVVGAYKADFKGAAYVFEYNGANWIEQQKLTANGGLADDEFGRAVAVEGDSIVIGAPEDDLIVANNPIISAAGSAYVFQRSGMTWTQTQQHFPTPGTSGPVGGDNFGSSVAMNSGRVAIGSSGDDSPQTRSGAIYVYTGGGGVYNLEKKLTIPGGVNGAKFGSSVALEGNKLVGGAPFYYPMLGQPAPGAAYVFEFNGAGGPGWNLQQRLTALNGADSDRFGWSVAISSNLVAVGAHFTDTVAGMDAGAAYVFMRIGNVWAEQKKFAPSDPFNGDRFGGSVAFGSNGLVVGAAEKQLNPGQGAAYYFIVPPKFDLDGDGKADFAILRPLRQMEWWVQVWLNNRRGPVAFGMPSDKPVPADFDGDGKTDIAVYRPSKGEWLILRSSDSSSYSIPFGNSEDKPAPDDFDGDGLADLAVFRASEGNWYVNNSSSGRIEVTELGKEGDMPLTGDFDGDGRADLGVFRPSTGQWIINQSTAGLIKTTFGTGTDKPVPADYTGDGKTDIAFWRAERGEWYVLRSEDFRYFVVPFGQNGDIPVAGDYDGDGKADIGVFRPDGANWFIQCSTRGLLIQQFGSSGDIPIPSVFVP